MNEKKYDIYCVGMKRIFYCGTDSGDEAFDMVPATCEKEILCCYIDKPYSKDKFEIELETSGGWCGSGYTTASYGDMCIKKNVKDFGPLTHVPKDHKPIKIDGAYYLWKKEDNKVTTDFIFNKTVEEDEYAWTELEINNNLFYYDPDGGDSYYPMGSAGVKDELFEELSRAFSNKPVWIFHGASATGKSTIAHLLEDKVVYETDSAENGILPDNIWADVIVIGNKWPNITLDAVCSRISDTDEIVTVGFERR